MTIASTMVNTKSSVDRKSVSKKGKSKSKSKSKTNTIANNTPASSIIVNTKVKPKKTKKQAQQQPSSTLKTLEKIKITGTTDISKYLPVLPLDMVRPKTWELTNRKSFYQWLLNNFGKYDTSDPSKVAQVKKEGINPNPDREPYRQLYPVQKLVRDFMATESPYRGLLLYFGLGVGKTLSAIAVSEAILNKRKVIFMSKANLEPNFIDTVMKAGQDYMVRNNYWIFATADESEQFDQLREQLHIPGRIVTENGGIYLIDYSTKQSNYDSLSLRTREALNRQIMALIHDRFEFLHTDSYTMLAKLEKLTADDKLIIIDEVHNVLNGMTKPGTMASRLYTKFMEAKNTKFITLSGSPIINTVFEVSKLFNFLRGYIEIIEFKILINFDLPIDYRKIRTMFKQNRYVDQIVVNQVNRTIQVTKNPDNYITSTDASNPGIVFVPDQPIVTIEQLKGDLETVLKSLNYKYSITMKKDTCLPEDQEEFDKNFYNPELNKIKKPEVIKKRIAGLLSFYDYKDMDQFPRLTAGSPHIVQCPMSPYQLGAYENVRADEIQKDKNTKRRKGGDDDVVKSTYRIDSRFACSFAYPDEVPNPKDLKKNKEDVLDALKDEMGEELDVDVDNEKAIEKFVKDNIMALLKKNRSKYFNIKSGALSIYSPKYVQMIKNIQKAPGLVLLYSSFYTMIGLNMFAIALEETGEWAKFEIKKQDGLWHLVSRNPDMESGPASGLSLDEKPMKYYAFYSGTETAEYRGIVKNIYNSEFDALDDSCGPLKASLKKLYAKGENLHGEVLKMLMITRTGAEGLDLKNVRSIHITEPYWQPVLIDQIIGRGVRNRSHIRLPLDERNVEVFVYMASIPSYLLSKITQPNVRSDFSKYNDGLGMKGKVVSSDEALYILSEHKKVITNQMLHLMKESAFDCTLNYGVNSKQHYDPQIVCLDSDTKDRDDYLYTPGIEDTKTLVDLNQEVPIVEEYDKFILPGNAKYVYYIAKYPNSEGKYFIYDESIMTKVRKPAPVGIMQVANNVKKYAWKKTEMDKWKK